MSASIKDVAAMAQVSIATVSNVINGTKKVNEDTRAKVLNAIETLHYSINLTARNLRKGGSNTIAFIVSTLNSNFYINIASSMKILFKKAGFNLIYLDSEENPEIEKINITQMMDLHIAGLVIVPVNPDCSYLEDLIGNKCPCVFVGRKPKGFHRDAVLANNTQAVKDCIDLLIQKGHKNIGFIAETNNSTVQERFRGYDKALEAYGIELNQDYIKIGSGEPETYSTQVTGEGYKLTSALLKNTEISAIFISDGMSTVGTLNYLLKNNYSIPGDIAIIAIDDAFWLEMFTPRITVSDQDTGAIGNKAAELILKRIEKFDQPYKTYRIKNRLIIRDSC